LVPGVVHCRVITVPLVGEAFIINKQVLA